MAGTGRPAEGDATRTPGSEPDSEPEPAPDPAPDPEPEPEPEVGRPGQAALGPARPGGAQSGTAGQFTSMASSARSVAACAEVRSVTASNSALS